jgi:23S rRNA pseudouridine2605 synthase
MSERLQKVLAQTGLGSRRSCENYIRAGRVTVNGCVATLGMKADPALDEIRVDGKLIEMPEELVYIALYKPTGVLSSNRSQGKKPTVFELVDISQRTFIIGRLDLDSEGLMILTNDGVLAHRLMHPRYEHEKEYRVLLNRMPDNNQLSNLSKGVMLSEGVKSLPARIWREDSSADKAWLRIVLRQGRKRQIREMMRTQKLQVRRLIRVRIGPIKLGNLQSGTWRYLLDTELKKLQRLSAEK